MQIVDPLVDYLEDPLVLVGLANVLDDVLAVRAVDSEHLCGVALIFELLQDLSIDRVLELVLPAA